jgi:glycine/D-amino acid oxidase-like deaminating enzyme
MAINRRSFLTKCLGLLAALGWNSSRPAKARQENSSKSSQNFEVAIIGAGLFGSAVARHLSNSIDGVALIGPAEPQDPRTHQGVFASHYDASRLVRIVDPDHLWATLAKRSIARFRDIERLSGIDFYHDGDTGRARHGLVQPARHA